MKNQQKTVSLALAGVLLSSALGGAFAPVAQARSSNKWQTGAIIGGVVGGYGLLKHNSTATIAGAGVAGYSLYRYNKDRSGEKARQRRFYQRRYGNNWRKHYPS